MGIVLSFGLGCLVTVWWIAKPKVKAAKRVGSTGTPCVTKTKNMVRRVEQRGANIQTARLSKKPAIDDELKDILLKYMVDQVKQGKIKIIEDVD